MYIEIQKLNEKGFSNTKIAKMLDISRPTVSKYLKMNIDEFERVMQSQQQRAKKPDIYRNEIISWINEHPDMTAAQVFDWLEEKYNKLNFSEGTIRNYVRAIREDYNIPKEASVRQYEAVEDPPFGKQMQVDFGEKKIVNAEGNIIKLYVMCFVLSNSRYKYCWWQAKPFNTGEIIAIHENAFEYFGGYPEEAVYDQDHLILVSENHGDLVYTKEFATYLKKRKFSVYMCRKADPESKGRIEKVVDFVKDNFASHRIFRGIDRWNEDCLKWLKRRGNGKVHQTTRKIPAEVFLEERKYLRPVTEKLISKPTDLSITYQVRKDNTVPIQGNRYTVPFGTYKGPHTYVGVRKTDNKYLTIYEIETKKELAGFEIPDTKGNLVRNNDHKREKTQKISTLMERLSEKFADNQKALSFLKEIQKEKPRYIRDQLTLIEKAISTESASTIEKALDYCTNNRLISAVDFKDAVKHYSAVTEAKETAHDNNTLSLLTEGASTKIGIKPIIRDLTVYTKIMSQSSGGSK